MQTFLPYPDFRASAACLDPQRLRKQRAEVVQLLTALDDPSDRNYNHPATKMWRGFRDALVDYGIAICLELMDRGEQDNTIEKIRRQRSTELGSVPYPKWLGRESFHASHRGNLMRKNPDWYRLFHWTDSPMLPYEWPVNHDPRLFRFQVK